MQELQEQLKVLTDTELIQEAGLPTFPDPLSGQEGCRSVESKDKQKSACSDMHLTTGFPLLFDGADNPKAQVRPSHHISLVVFDNRFHRIFAGSAYDIYTPNAHDLSMYCTPRCQIQHDAASVARAACRMSFAVSGPITKHRVNGT